MVSLIGAHRNKIVFWIFIIALLCYKVFIVEQVVTRPLKDFDEARYAEVAKNTIRSGNWLIPRAGGPDDISPVIVETRSNGTHLYPYFWKPPLHTAVVSVSYLIFEVNEFAVRLPSIIFGIGLLVVVFKLVNHISKNLQISSLTILLIVLASDFSFLISQGLAETQALFFGVSSIYLACFHDKKRIVLAGVCGGLAFMTKSFATLWILPVVTTVLLLIHLPKVRIRNLLWYSISYIIIALPWHLYMFGVFGQLFINRYLIVNTIGRAVIHDQNKAPMHWYFIYMLDVWKPYVFASLALAPIIFDGLLKKNKLVILMFVWLISVLMPFSLAQSKVWWYVFPSFIPLSILIAYGIQIGLVRHNVLLILACFFIIVSRLPYWQLSFSHIPFKPFIVFALICSAFAYAASRINLNIPNLQKLILLCLFFILIHWYTFPLTQHRDFGTGPIKNLAREHENLTNLGVFALPYEAILFYFDTGAVTYDWGSADYVVSREENMNLLAENGFTLLDQNQDIILVQKK